MDHSGLSTSHEAIYQYIYHPDTDGRLDLIGCLRRNHRKRSKVRGTGRKERRTKIPGRIPIDMRPDSVEKHLHFGHWEGNNLVSRKSRTALSSLAERKSRLLRLTKVEGKTAEATCNAIIRRLENLPEKARMTLTLDNGTENTMYHEVTSAIGIKCFFAHPYASWERGTNENTNGLVRWHLPKGTDFSKMTDEQIARIESLINNPATGGKNAWVLRPRSK